MVQRKTPLFLLSIITIALASCSHGNIVPGKGKDLVLTSIQQQNSVADNAFTLKLYKNLDSAGSRSANLFVSPLSVSIALGMTSNGSSGQTLAAIKNTLDFSSFSQDEMNSYFHTLLTQLPQLDPNTTLKIANSIWYNQNFAVLPAFIQTNTSSFNAKVQSLDFGNTSSVSAINNWVSGQTNGAIPKVIDQVSASDVMYLINAIYFKSIWKEKFDAALTHALPFTLADNSTVETSFMDASIDFKTYTDKSVSVYELPYENDKYSMVIVLPPAGTPLQQITAGIDTAKWQSWMNGLAANHREIELPKFKFSYNMNLNDALTSLGMGIAFTPGADFSLISATEKVQITKVLQNAYVDVDESGTTAAAATTVVMGTTAAAPPPPVIINRPFMFAIRQVSSGLILFTGTVNNPTL